MRLRTTLLLLVLVAAAALVIRSLGDPPLPEPSRQPLVAPETLAQVQEIELSLLSQERIKLERDPAGKFMVRFGTTRAGESFLHRDEADEERVDQLLRALDESVREPLRDELTGDAAMRMQLDPPKYEVVLKTQEQAIRVRLGANDPSGHGVLGVIDSEGRAFRTGRQVANLLEFNAADFRSREVISLDPLAITGLEWIEDPDAPAPKITTLRMEGARDWWVTQPRRLKADPLRAGAIAQKVGLMKVKGFIADSFDAPNVREHTGLPDSPRYILNVNSGPTVHQMVLIGQPLTSEEISACIPWRNEQLCMSILLEDLEKLKRQFDLGEVRYRRLAPVLQSTAIRFECADADGRLRWRFRRKGDHKKGEWEIEEPFQALANVAQGEHSFAQVVSDFDQLEVVEFLDSDRLAQEGRPFQPQARLSVYWNADPVILDKAFDVQMLEDSAIVRATDLPDELLRVGAKLGDTVRLKPELYRHKTLLPEDEGFLQKITRFELRKGGRPRILVTKKPGQSAPVAEIDPYDQSTGLQSECSGLRGAPAFALRLPEEAPDWGESDSDSVYQAIVVAGETEYVFTIGKPCDLGYYCTLHPVFPDVVLIVQRHLVQGFLDLRVD